MSTNDVKSARRVLDILQFFAQIRAPATPVANLGRTDIPKSSCLALLDTLEGDGYAHQTAGRYYLTRRWLNEARVVAEHDQLTTRIRPVLESLRDELGETLILAQRAGELAVYLDVAEPDRIVRFTAQVGQLKPLHASASGRALLGAMPPQEREALVARLTLNRYTDKTIKTGKQLLQRITAEANRGWHINPGRASGRYPVGRRAAGAVWLAPGAGRWRPAGPRAGGRPHRPGAARGQPATTRQIDG